MVSLWLIFAPVRLHVVSTTFQFFLGIFRPIGFFWYMFGYISVFLKLTWVSQQKVHQIHYRVLKSFCKIFCLFLFEHRSWVQLILSHCLHSKKVLVSFFWFRSCGLFGINLRNFFYACEHCFLELLRYCVSSNPATWRAFDTLCLTFFNPISNLTSYWISSTHGEVATYFLRCFSIVELSTYGLGLAPKMSPMNLRSAILSTFKLPLQKNLHLYRFYQTYRISSFGLSPKCQ